MPAPFITRRKGFTLIELLMVVAIIGILVAIVAPAVAGTGRKGTEAQVESDAKQSQTAVDNYNNKSTKTGQWPEATFGTKYKAPANGSRKYEDKQGAVITNFESTHTELNADASTKVWQASGDAINISFVPGFLLKVPSSFILDNDEALADSTGSPLPEFLWLLKITAAGSNSEGRLVEVYQLIRVDAGSVAVYRQLF